MLEEIVSYFEKGKTDSSAIPRSEVMRWIASDDPEVIGAAYTLLVDAAFADRIVPAPSFDEIFEFFLRYYEFCLTTDPQGEWVDDRFNAGCEFVRIFVGYWEEGLDQRYFVTMKSLLRRLYLEGSPDLQQTIVQAIVEHLFEKEPIRIFFGDWRDDPQLRQAYSEGSEWAEGCARRAIQNKTESWI
jgi:hypothetical protein